LIRIYLLIFCAAILGEYSARIYTDKSGSPVDRVLGLLKTDPVLGWRLKSSLDLNFYGARVITNESGFRVQEGEPTIDTKASQIWFLGPSSTFGWGVENSETYASQTAEILSIGKAANLGQIGYTSIQGERLLSELQPPPKSIAVLAYGLNELDRYRFFFPTATSDRDFFSNSIPTGMLWAGNLTSFFQSLRVSARWIAKTRNQYFCSVPDALPLRASVDDYLASMSVLVQRLRQLNVQVLLVDTPYRPDPIKSSDPNASGNYLKAAAAASRNGDCKGAENYIKQFHNHETGRIRRDIETLNQRLTIWSEDSAVPLVKASQILTKQEDFFDPVHPSKIGHRLLGTAIANRIRASNFLPPVE
jgi:lysophospholipase L1-like esterase